MVVGFWDKAMWIDISIRLFFYGVIAITFSTPSCLFVSSVSLLFAFGYRRALFSYVLNVDIGVGKAIDTRCIHIMC